MFINLGTNDAVKGVSLDDAEKGLVDMAAKFPDACIVFATINKNTTIPVYNAKASALNDWLFANAPAHRRLERHRHRGLHEAAARSCSTACTPTTRASAQYAQIICDALDTCPS